MVPTMPSFTLSGINSETSTNDLFSRAIPVKASFPRDDALGARGCHHMRPVDWPEKLQKNVDPIPGLGQASVWEDQPRAQVKTFEKSLRMLLSGEAGFSRAVVQTT